jgi:hypothetical protein
MKPLHSWNVSVEEAIQIQEALKDRIILKKPFSKVRTMGGGDVAYSKNENRLFGAIVVLSFPDMEILDMATADGKIPFPLYPQPFKFSGRPNSDQNLSEAKNKSRCHDLGWSRHCPSQRNGSCLTHGFMV